LKLKIIDIIFIIAISVLTIISIDLLLNEAHQRAITNIWENTYLAEKKSIGLSLVFIVCLIGNLLPVPTPYSWVVCLGYTHFETNVFIPLLYAFVASMGCLIGEMGGYLVGRGVAEVISEERAQNLKKYEEYLINHPKLAPFLIFLFGLTPLNDDLLTVPLGLIKYDPKKTVFFMWCGKFGMMTIFAYNLFGICGLIGGENWYLSIASLYIIVIMIYIMVRIDVFKGIKEAANKANNNLKI